MQGQQLNPDEWMDTQKDCARRWHAMTAEERSQYHAKAAEEQGNREEACLQPFSSIARSRNPRDPSLPDPIFPAAFDAAQHLSKNSLKRVGRHRTFTSYLEFKESNLWQHHEAGLATSDGALGLDLIDLESTEEDITHKWDLFARSKADGDWELPADGNIIHNTTCFKDYGGCRKFLKQEVCLLVHNLAKHVESGDSQ